MAPKCQHLDQCGFARANHANNIDDLKDRELRTCTDGSSFDLLENIGR